MRGCCVGHAGASIAPAPTTTDPGPEGTTSPDDGTEPGATSGGADETTDAQDATGDPIKLDVGSPDTTTMGEQDYCNFVDLLFVIDNSLSMNEYQTQLALAWPSFVDAMWNNLPIGTWTGYRNTTNSQTGGTAFTPSAAATAAAFSGTGGLFVFVGATVSPAAAQAAGSYTGTVTLTAAYF